MHVPLGKNEKTVNQNYMNNLWKHHNCPINHEGSAGSMEAGGLVDCFMK